MFPDSGYGRGSFAQHPNPQMAKSREQMLEQNWSDPAWNANNISEENVLAYFCRRANPFYESNCLNEQEVMQAGRWMPGQINSYPGTQYMVAHHKPPLYIIRKIMRDQSRNEKTLDIYAVMNGVVYQVPDLGAVLNSRIATSLFHIREAFNATLPHLNYNSSKGFHWDSEVSPSSTAPGGEKDAKDGKTAHGRNNESNEKEPSDPLDCKSTWFQRTRVDGLLLKLTERFPVHPDQQVPPATNSDSKPEKAELDRITALKNEHGVGGSGHSGSAQSRASSRQSSTGPGGPDAAASFEPMAKRIKVEI